MWIKGGHRFQFSDASPVTPPIEDKRPILTPTKSSGTQGRTSLAGNRQKKPARFDSVVGTQILEDLLAIGVRRRHPVLGCLGFARHLR